MINDKSANKPNALHKPQTIYVKINNCMHWIQL